VRICTPLGRPTWEQHNQDPKGPKKNLGTRETNEKGKSQGQVTVKYIYRSGGPTE